MKTLLILSIMFALAGCSTQRFNLNGAVDNTDVPTHTGEHTFFVAGIGQTETVNAAAVCGSADKVVAVQAKTSFLNGLLSSITYTIYSPKEYSIFCKNS